MRRPHILLTGHGGSWNRGCQAIVQCTIALIREHLPGARIAILSGDPASDRAAMADFLDGEVISERYPEPPDRYTWAWLRHCLAVRLAGGYPSLHLFLNRRFYRWADILLSVGGDNFSDDYGSPAPFFEELAWARAQGARTVIWAASIGLFQKPEDESRWAEELHKVDLITVRESITLAYLQQLGVSSNVHLVADPAFLLPSCGAGLSVQRRIAGRPIVGIGVNAIAGHHGVCGEPYLEVMRRFADSLLRDDEDVHLLLVPHVTMAGQYDDHPLCLSLAERLSAPERVSVLSRTLDACQMKHAIGECDCFIGARTHSTIASLSLLVPTLSIAYSTKAYGLNRDLFGHERYVVHVREASPERLMNAYRQLRREQDEVRSRLHRAIPLACERARHGARLLRTLCQ